jgi:lipoyl(octanoyl) transferase
MKSLTFGHDLSDYGLSPQNITQVSPSIFVIKRWNWEYSKAHAFQLACLKEVEKNSLLKFVICCSHPHVFTYGRGLQKPKKGETLELQDITPEQLSLLPYPCHQIERGGGLTFHHPGQLIIYPILRLNTDSLSLSSLINHLFDTAADILTANGMKQLTHERKLLGLWCDDKKIASMGIAVRRLITFHGMALNFYTNEEMKIAMQKLFPCGINPDTYRSVQELLPDLKLELDQFADDYLRRLTHAW